MRATKTHTACTIHKDRMWLPLWLDKKKNNNKKTATCMQNSHQKWWTPEIKLWMQNKKWIHCHIRFCFSLVSLFVCEYFRRSCRVNCVLCAHIIRHLTTHEVSAALRPFYFMVHPDLFGQFPSERVCVHIGRGKHRSRYFYHKCLCSYWQGEA